MKRPSFQFYPGDWQANSNLRRCTHEEKGIWIDVMCLLHDQEEYGVVRWPLKEIAQAIGCTVQKVRGLVSKGVLKGADAGESCSPLIYIPRSGRKDGAPVTLIPQQSGPIWFSSRMVEDEYKRVLRGEHGGEPKPTPDPSPKGGIGATPKPTPDPSPSRARASSSSSSSPSGKPKEEAAAVDLPHAAADPIHGRAIELTAMLRKRGAALQASDPRLRRWAETGITDAQALAALETAQQRREEQGNHQPINAGYLDAILKDATGTGTPTKRRGNIHDERAATIAGLTGRDRKVEHGQVIDGSAVVVD